MITVMLLNWKRPENVQVIVRAHAQNLLVSKIYVWNNSDVPLLFDNKPKHLTVISADSNQTFYPRFVLPTLCLNDAVLLQDDDLLLSVETVEALYAKWKEDPTVLHGIFGRKPKSDGSYADVVRGDAAAPIILTRAVMASRDNLVEFLKQVPSFEPIQRASQPYGNGEDIILSYVTAKKSGKENRVHSLPVQELPAPNAVSAHSNHYLHRDRLMKFCDRWKAGVVSSPKVTAICCTYKRPVELSESIACFLAQDYPPELCEMLILDDAGQYEPGAFIHPRVKLISIPERFKTVGEKRNASVALSSSDTSVYCVWDDDDIYLPWHISACVNATLAGADYTIPTKLFVHANDELVVKENQYMYHGAWSFTAEIFNAVNGYPWIQSGQDQGLLKRLKARGAVRGNSVSATFKPSYVYRWFSKTASARWHLSAQKGGYEFAGKLLAPKVTTLNPKLGTDWVTECSKLSQ